MKCRLPISTEDEDAELIRKMRTPFDDWKDDVEMICVGAHVCEDGKCLEKTLNEMPDNMHANLNFREAELFGRFVLAVLPTCINFCRMPVTLECYADAIQAKTGVWLSRIYGDRESAEWHRLFGERGWDLRSHMPVFIKPVIGARSDRHSWFAVRDLVTAIKAECSRVSCSVCSKKTLVLKDPSKYWLWKRSREWGGSGVPVFIDPAGGMTRFFCSPQCSSLFHEANETGKEVRRQKKDDGRNLELRRQLASMAIMATMEKKGI